MRAASQAAGFGRRCTAGRSRITSSAAPGTMQSVSTRAEILELLSDGRPCAPADIAATLGLETGRLEHEIKGLIGSGLPIAHLADGYCLQVPLYPLRARKIRELLDADAAGFGRHLWVCAEVDSTNSYLQRKINATPSVRQAACLAEVQTMGRGQRGRAWVSTPHANIMLSVSWTLPSSASGVGGLTLACGVALARALTDSGIEGVGLKWPNDLLWRGRKLAGLLAEAHPRSVGDTIVIVGAGVNVYLAEPHARLLDQPWVDLTTILGYAPDRNHVVAHILKRLWETFVVFERTGFGSFREAWERMHVYQGQHVRLYGEAIAGGGRVIGAALDGALQLIDKEGQLRQFYSGDVSVRSQSWTC